MERKKTDRRTQYTKMVLKKSLIDLLRVKPIAKITVKEICEAADINRVTFYAHYKDAYDLLEQIQQEVVDGILERIQAVSISRAAESKSALYAIFEFMSEHADACKVLISRVAFPVQLMDFLRENNRKVVRDAGILPGNTAADYLNEFVTTGAAGVIKRWLEGDMKHSPQEIADFLLEIVTYGVSGFLRVNPDGRQAPAKK